MRLRGSTRAAAFAVAVAAFAGSMTGIAWAPKNLSVHVIEADCEVKDAGTGAFLGSVTLTGFTILRGQLFGVASVTGTCTVAGRNVAVSEQRALVPVSIQELSCAKLDLMLGDLASASAGTTVRTAGSHLLVVPGSRSAEARFCAAERLAGIRPIADMLTPLGQLLFQ